MKEIDSRSMARDTYRHLRGRRSQLAVSRWLGFRSNVLYAWESGKRQPDALAVFAWARRAGVDLEAGLARFFRAEAAWLEGVRLDDREGLCALLAHLREDRTVVDVAKRSGFSRFQVSRWLRGVADVGFEELLVLIEAMTARVHDFLAIVADPAALPSTAEAWSQLESARELFWRHPEAQLVLLALELADYLALPAHDDHYLARRLDLPLYQVVAAIERLALSGQIRLEGRHYRRADVKTVDTRRNPSAGDELKAWWWRTAESRLLQPDSSVSFNVFTCSEADLEAIREIYRNAYRAMRAVVASSAPDERLALLASAIVPLEQASPGE